MTELDPYRPTGPGADPYASQHETPTRIGSPYDVPAGGHPGGYAGGYPGGYPGGSSFAPSGPPSYPPPGRGPGVGAVLGVVLVVALLLAGLGTGAYFLLRPASSTASAATAPATAAGPAPAAASPAPAAPNAPTAPSAPSGSSGSSATGTGGTTSLSQVFPASTGAGCTAYTPAAGEYVTSAGHQAGEVRACAAGTSGNDGVVYTRWPSPGDAASVVSDQARTSTSVNGKDTWTMGGTTQGDYHEARQSDGTCRAFLDYTAAPYAVVLSAPTCSGVEQLFQQTTLPDAATLPR